MNLKSKMCCGAVLSLMVGLSGCDMLNTHHSEHMDRNHERMDNTHHKMMNGQPVKTKAQAKGPSYASKDPTRKATPGPVHKAAPQLPVIQ